MADTKAKTEPEKKTQEAPVPSAEQKTTESEVVEEEVKEITQPTKEEALPEEASERTKREFEKLREQLRDERARREYFEQVFSSMQPQKQPEVAPVIDPETGLPSEQALTDLQKRSLEAERRATRAEEAIQGYLTEQENRAVYAQHPELNPSSDKFDKNLHIKVRGLLLDSMLNPADYGNRQLGFMEAVDQVKGESTKTTEEAKKEGATEAMKQTESKEQASLEATGTSGRRTEIVSDLEELKRRTRRGDINAIVERLKGTQE